MRTITVTFCTIIIGSFLLSLTPAGEPEAPDDENMVDDVAGFGKSVVAVRPRWSDRRMTLTCENCTGLELGRLLTKQQLISKIPLRFDEYDEFVHNGDKAMILDHRRINVDLHDIPILEGAAEIASQLKVNVSRDFAKSMGYLAMRDGFDSPIRYWTAVGPLLLVARMTSTSNAENPAEWELRVSPVYFDAEADQTAIVIRDVEVVTKSGEAVPINMQRATNGEWLGALTVSPAELTGIRGRVLAIVARDLLEIQIRPGQSCTLSKPYKVDVRCADVQKTNRLFVVPMGSNEESEVRFKEEGKPIYHATLQMRWAKAPTPNEISATWDFNNDSRDDIRMDGLQDLMRKRTFLQFERNINKTPSDRIIGEVTPTFRYAAHVEGAPRAEFVQDDFGMSICLCSPNADEVDTCHELVFSRREIFRDTFQIDIPPSRTDVYARADSSKEPDGEPVAPLIRESSEPDMTNSIGIPFILIPAGEFMMGGDQLPGEVGRNRSHGEALHKPSFYVNEHPQHKVRIGKPFYMSVYEVTQSEWENVTGSNPSHYAASGGEKAKVEGQDTSRFPVEAITWYDAIEFCNRLSGKDKLDPYYTLRGVKREEGKITHADVLIAGGTGYRLPTEAEWEYTCRAGTTTAFHFGNTCNKEQANLLTGYPEVKVEPEKWFPFLPTKAVGSFEPNAFGLYDMHGNVAEWCFDVHDRTAFMNRGEITVDPVVLRPSDDALHNFADPVDDWFYYDYILTGQERVIRGGDSSQSAGMSRSACRYCGNPSYGWGSGLRLARDQ
ncbi:MAG: formylglycine-generating enzyme family protein [Planctomycetaceae bacterium]